MRGLEALVLEAADAFAREEPGRLHSQPGSNSRLAGGSGSTGRRSNPPASHPHHTPTLFFFLVSIAPAEGDAGNNDDSAAGGGTSRLLQFGWAAPGRMLEARVARLKVLYPAANEILYFGGRKTSPVSVAAPLNPDGPKYLLKTLSQKEAYLVEVLEAWRQLCCRSEDDPGNGRRRCYGTVAVPSTKTIKAMLITDGRTLLHKAEVAAEQQAIEDTSTSGGVDHDAVNEDLLPGSYPTNTTSLLICG